MERLDPLAQSIVRQSGNDIVEMMRAHSIVGVGTPASSGHEFRQQVDTHALKLGAWLRGQTKVPTTASCRRALEQVDAYFDRRIYADRAGAIGEAEWLHKGFVAIGRRARYAARSSSSGCAAELELPKGPADLSPAAEPDIPASQPPAEHFHKLPVQPAASQPPAEHFHELPAQPAAIDLEGASKPAEVVPEVEPAGPPPGSQDEEGETEAAEQDPPAEPVGTYQNKAGYQAEAEEEHQEEAEEEYEEEAEEEYQEEEEEEYQEEEEEEQDERGAEEERAEAMLDNKGGNDGLPSMDKGWSADEGAFGVLTANGPPAPVDPAAFTNQAADVEAEAGVNVDVQSAEEEPQEQPKAPKKSPSAYNHFIRDRMASLKEEGWAVCKERFKMAAAEWSARKQETSGQTERAKKKRGGTRGRRGLRHRKRNHTFT